MGRYSPYRYNIDTENNRYVSIRSSCRIDTEYGDCRKNETTIPERKIRYETMLPNAKVRPYFIGRLFICS